MKIKYLMLFIALFLLGGCCSCLNDSDAIDTTSSYNTQPALDGSTFETGVMQGDRYVDSKYGFSLVPPSEWELKLYLDGTLINFIAPFAEDQGALETAAVIIIVYEQVAPGITLQEYGEQAKESFIELGATISNEQSQTIAGKSAKTFEYEAKNIMGEFKGKYYFIEKATGEMLIFHYTVPIARYNDYLGEFESAIQTLQLTPTASLETGGIVIGGNAEDWQGDSDKDGIHFLMNVVTDEFQHIIKTGTLKEVKLYKAEGTIFVEPVEFLDEWNDIPITTSDYTMSYIEKYLEYNTEPDLGLFDNSGYITAVFEDANGKYYEAVWQTATI